MKTKKRKRLTATEKKTIAKIRINPFGYIIKDIPRKIIRNNKE